MNLYLLRHGRAEDRAATDSERALTEEGLLQVASTAAQFRARGFGAARCLVSPYLRARQTAERFLSDAGLDLPRESCDLLRPETGSLDLLHFLQRQPEADILLIGHNPLLSDFCTLLREGEARARVGLGTGELVALTMDAVVAGCAGTLCHLVPDPC